MSPRLGRRFPLRRPGRALAELHHRLRTEGDAPAAKALSVGIGTAIGCLPLYGLHLPLCLVASRLLRLSLVRTYLAAHVNNPLTAPLLLYVQLALGRWLAGGGWPAPTPEELAGAGGWSWSTAGREVMVGGLAFGLALGGALGLAAWAVGRRWRRPPFEAALIEATAWRYLDAGIATWEFVRGKLHRDPVYLALLASGELPRRGRLVDLGCGHGIALALLATAAEWPGGGGTGSRAGGAAAGAAGAPRGAAGGEAEPAATAGGAAGNADGAAGAPAAGPPAPDWPAGGPAPPAGLELIGIERAPKRAATARSALAGGTAEVRQGDLAAAEIPACDAALLLDVQHYLGAADQEALLDRAARALVPDGVLLVREADAAGGLRFALTRAAERLAALARGRWRQRFHYRSAGEWARLLAARGLEVETRPMGRGTPFANVLLVARKPDSSAGPGVPTGPGPSSGR